MEWRRAQRESRAINARGMTGFCARDAVVVWSFVHVSFFGLLSDHPQTHGDDDGSGGEMGMRWPEKKRFSCLLMCPIKCAAASFFARWRWVMNICIASVHDAACVHKPLICVSTSRCFKDTPLLNYPIVSQGAFRQTQFCWFVNFSNEPPSLHHQKQVVDSILRHRPQATDGARKIISEIC